jgi:hypothetical protein
MMIVMLAIVALPVAASEGTGVNLPGWVAWLMVLLALALPIIVLANMRHRD